MATDNGHVVVTGGASGIGLAVVERLIGRGVHVSVLDAQPMPAGAVAASSSLLRSFAVDVTDEPEVGAALEEARGLFGLPCGLVTSAGIRGEFLPAAQLHTTVLQRVLAVHILGTLIPARIFYRMVSDERPPDAPADAAVVTVSSTTAYGGWEKQADYGVAKAGVSQLTKNLAMEWAACGIRVNGVAPGITRTPLMAEMIEEGYDTAEANARTPLGRMADPGEIASAIEFLLFDATYMTGTVVPVDGGWTSRGK